MGEVLIAINPFEDLPLYTAEILREYLRTTTALTKPPHPYRIGSYCHHAMCVDGHDHAICISGESGAGKTETMKMMLRCLIAKAGAAANELKVSDDGVEERILATNPITEAFGNAATLRNNNSSRFGKWTELSFTGGGALIAANIKHYLLEKSRVSVQGAGERNYHIFYQLLFSLKDVDALPEQWIAPLSDLEKELKLGASSSALRFLNQSGTDNAPGVNDAESFTDLLTAFQSVPTCKDHCADILRVVAAVLHVGNINFQNVSDADENACVADVSHVELIASLLGMAPDALRQALTLRTLPDPAIRGAIRMPLTVPQADGARDAFARFVFNALFDWLFLSINDALSESDGRRGTAKRVSMIGVLDIFGFESFENNSLEQLCINLTNEKLQFFFNKVLFTTELNVLKEEGVAMDIDVSVVHTHTLRFCFTILAPPPPPIPPTPFSPSSVSPTAPPQCLFLALVLQSYVRTAHPQRFMSCSVSLPSTSFRPSYPRPNPSLLRPRTAEFSEQRSDSFAAREQDDGHLLAARDLDADDDESPGRRQRKARQAASGEHLPRELVRDASSASARRPLKAHDAFPCRSLCERRQLFDHGLRREERRRHARRPCPSRVRLHAAAHGAALPAVRR